MLHATDVIENNTVEDRTQQFLQLIDSKLLLVICGLLSVLFVPTFGFVETIVLSVGASFIFIINVFTLLFTSFDENRITELKNQGGKSLNRGKVLEREIENAKNILLFAMKYGILTLLYGIGYLILTTIIQLNINLFDVFSYSMSIEYGIVLLQTILSVIIIFGLYYIISRFVLSVVCVVDLLLYIIPEYIEIE